MLKKFLKSILNQSTHHKYGSSSDVYKKRSHHQHSHMGHGYYKRKHKSHSFFSSRSSFFSS